MASGRKTQWKNYFLELLVVVIGISIAFGLERWGENQRDRDTERNYLESLKKDLTEDIKSMGVIIDSSKVLRDNSYALFGFIYGALPIDSLKKDYITSTYTAPYFNPNDGTFHSLVNSGSLGLIENYEIRSALTDLYNVDYDEIQFIDDFLKELTSNQIYPYMLENIRFRMGDGGVDNIEPLKTNLAINLIGSYWNFMRKRISIYETVKSNSTALRDSIASELKR